MKKTIIVQIGNSDDKLSQKRWSEFILAVNRIMDIHRVEWHFFGASAFNAPWQNVCFVGNIEEININLFLDDLLTIRLSFQQDSVAFTVGESRMI